MDTSKDYYATLGVLPTAEDVVIRAAYKALAQRYHPDRNPSDKAEATRRMAEINEAYAILSDPARRREYDALRPSKDQADETDIGVDEGNPPPDDALDADWRLATKYHPELDGLVERLGKISRRLAFTFRVFMLETKGFKNCRDYAAALERNFLEQYFGKNSAIIAFATTLILGGNRKAALELNNVVRVLGDGLDSELVIDSISKEFGLTASPPQPCPQCQYSLRLDAPRYTKYGCPNCFSVLSIVESRQGEFALKVLVEAKGKDFEANTFPIGAIVTSPLSGKIVGAAIYRVVESKSDYVFVKAYWVLPNASARDVGVMLLDSGRQWTLHEIQPKLGARTPDALYFKGEKYQCLSLRLWELVKAVGYLPGETAAVAEICEFTDGIRRYTHSSSGDAVYAVSALSGMPTVQR